MNRWFSLGLCFIVGAGVSTSCAINGGEQILGRDDSDSGSSFAPTFGEDASADGEASVAVPEKVLACIGTECPYPYATCPRSGGFIPYMCEANLLIDDMNCGACGNACPTSFPQLNMRTHCIDGACRGACNSGFQDCNGLVDDGCEVATSVDPDNCGVCGNECPELTNGVRGCVDGKCNSECLAPWTWCADKSLCADLAKDNNNCGACGNRCPPSSTPAPPQMLYACGQGKCGQLACRGGWADCNKDIDPDGCEVDLANDRNNCGACGNVCAPGQICGLRGGAFTCICEPNETLCADSYCADLLTATDNCGACRNVCPELTNGTAVCRNGFCENECLPGWSNCDGDLRNGCETDLTVNPNHCGACGNQCDVAAGQPCVDGKCLMVECDAGRPVTR